MKNFFLLTSILICMLSLSFFFGCEDINKPNNNPTTNYGYVSGKVVNASNTPLQGIEVKIGNISVTTDSKGFFFISKVQVADRVLVNFSGNGYTSTQKIISIKASKTSFVDATVVYLGLNQNFNTAAGGNFNLNGNAKLNLPPNAFVDSKGNAFNGTARINATYFDPSSAGFYGCFPGEFKGTRTDNSETSIESFGFVSVDIFNGTEKLQLANGQQATITFPIPAALQAKAPATIPLWYYNEATGKWMEEGTATKTGSNYVGTVRHFSSWNCDRPNETSFLSGKVVDNNGNPVAMARVHSTGIDYSGSSIIFTDDNGNFKLPVKSSANAKVWASYHIFQSTSQNIATDVTGAIKDIGNLSIPIDTTNLCVITGRIIDNGNNALQYANISILDTNNKKLDYSYTTADGKFKFFGESGKKYIIEITIYGNSTDSSATKKRIEITTPNQGTLDMGDIKMDVGGSTIIGRVLDANSKPILKAYISTNEVISPNQREMGTDSLGKFSLWVRPNKTFKINVYYNKLTKSVDVTSGNLGETKDIGDIIIQ